MAEPNRVIPVLPYYPSRSKEYNRLRSRIRHNYINKSKTRMSWIEYNNRASSKESHKQYYITNKERITLQKKEHYQYFKREIKERAHKYYEENKIIIKDKTGRYYQSWKNYNKFLTLFHYSEGKMCCKNCGENIFELLTIDHINGGGNKHRKIIGNRNIHVWLKNNNFPDGYQILCYNCNMVKHRVSKIRYTEIIRELQGRKLFMDDSIRKVV